MAAEADSDRAADGGGCVGAASANPKRCGCFRLRQRYIAADLGIGHAADLPAGRDLGGAWMEDGIFGSTENLYNPRRSQLTAVRAR